MFRKVIFGIFILMSTTLIGQEIHVPKIPVYDTQIVQGNSPQFYPPLYYVPHYIEFKAPLIIQEPPKQIYYPPPPLIINNQTYPTPIRNWILGPRIYYNPAPVIIR